MDYRKATYKCARCGSTFEGKEDFVAEELTYFDDVRMNLEKVTEDYYYGRLKMYQTHHECTDGGFGYASIVGYGPTLHLVDELPKISGISEETMGKIHKLGIHTKEQLRNTPDDEITSQVRNVGIKTLAKLREATKE